MLSLVRPRYFVPVHGEYRQLAQHARVAERVIARAADAELQVLLAENGDILQFDRRRRAHRRQGAGRPRADRRHAHRRSRRRGAARSPPSRRRRPGRAGRRDQPADRRARRRARDHRARLRHGRRRPSDCSPTARARASPSVIARRSVEERTDQGLMKEKHPRRAAAVLQEAFGPAAVRAAGRHGDLTGAADRPCRGASASSSAWRCLRRR